MFSILKKMILSFPCTDVDGLISVIPLALCLFVFYVCVFMVGILLLILFYHTLR